MPVLDFFPLTPRCPYCGALIGNLTAPEREQHIKSCLGNIVKKPEN